MRRVPSRFSACAYGLTALQVAETPGGAGGGVLIVDGPAAITESAIVGNSANSGGGVYHVTNQALTIRDTTISGNHAATNGGGFYNNGVTVTLSNVTLAGNDARTGRGPVTAEACSSLVAASPWRTRSSRATPPLAGRIRTAPGTTQSQGYNLVFPGAGCGFNQTTDQVNRDPKLGPLQFNGGPTETMALAAKSAAIDAGTRRRRTARAWPVRPPTSAARPGPVDGNGLNGAQCDIGADEAAFCTTRGPNVKLEVSAGLAGRLTVDVTAGAGNIQELRLHALPSSNMLVTIGGQERSGDITVPINAPTAQFSLRRANGSGAGTLPFDVVDGCGVWKTLAGGGPNAWGGGGSAPVGGPADRRRRLRARR